jgi:hypothetical protein
MTGMNSTFTCVRVVTTVCSPSIISLRGRVMTRFCHEPEEGVASFRGEELAGHPRPAGKAEEGGAPGLCGDRRERRQAGCGVTRIPPRKEAAPSRSV